MPNPSSQTDLFASGNFRPGVGQERGERKVAALAEKALRVQPSWYNAARVAIKALAISGVPFTSEDVFKAIGYPFGLDHRTIGSALREARIAGIIRATGRWVTATARSRNGGACREWIGAKAA